MTSPIEAKGDDKVLTHVRVKSNEDGSEKDIEANGLFYAVGHKLNTDFNSWLFDTGYIITIWYSKN